MWIKDGFLAERTVNRLIVRDLELLKSEWPLWVYWLASVGPVAELLEHPALSALAMEDVLVAAGEGYYGL